jgi:hypothetical protein
LPKLGYSESPRPGAPASTSTLPLVGTVMGVGGGAWVGTSVGIEVEGGAPVAVAERSAAVGVDIGISCAHPSATRRTRSACRALRVFMLNLRKKEGGSRNCRLAKFAKAKAVSTPRNAPARFYPAGYPISVYHFGPSQIGRNIGRGPAGESDFCGNCPFHREEAILYLIFRSQKG